MVDQDQSVPTLRSTYSYLPVPRIEILREITPPGEPHGPQYLRVVSDAGCRDVPIPDNVTTCEHGTARMICVASSECPTAVWDVLVSDPESVPVVDRRPR